MVQWCFLILTVVTATMAASTGMPSQGSTATKEESSSSVAPTKSPTTTTVAPTTTTLAPTTTSTKAPTTTEAPALGVSCNNNTDWCNASISGQAECGTDNKCRCVPGHFQFNTTMCIPDIDLIPLKLQTSDVTNSSFSISWSPKDNVKGINISYNVSAKPASNEKGLSEEICVVNASVTMASCQGLLSGYLYNGTVTAVYMSRSLSAIKQESTIPNIPGMINNAASSFNAPNVTLVWTASSGKVDIYSINVTRSDDNSIVIKNEYTTDNQTEISLEGLTAGTIYTVFITAYSYGKSSPERKDTFRTLTDIPGLPKGLTVSSVTNNSIKLSWSVTDQPNGDIRGHQVCMRYKVYNDLEYTAPVCENITEATKLQYEKSGLTAGTYYQFDVYTINDMYIGSNSSIGQRTNESVPGMVSGLTVVPNDVIIKVTWQRPSQPNGDIIQYQVLWTGQTNEQNCTNYLESPQGSSVKTQCYHNISETDISLNQKSMNYTIIGLLPHTEYTIHVIAFTSVGPGDAASKTTHTSISVPDPVTNVIADVLNATAVNISWTIPNVNPGPISYTVKTHNMVDNSIAEQECSVQNYTSSSCVVTGLQEYWIYNFSVTASTDAGTSDPTMSKNVTTEEAEPGQLSQLKYTLFNGSEDCDATSVRFNWSEPNLPERNSLIRQYRFYAENLANHTYNVTSPDPYRSSNRNFNYTLNHLKPEETYKWKIFAVSVNGTVGEGTTINVTQGVCYPPKWNTSEINKIQNVSSTTSSVTIQLPSNFFKKNEQGSVLEKGLIVIPKGTEDTGIEYGSLDSWKKAQSTQFHNKYKVIIEEIDGKVEIGQDTGCSSATTTENKYCNGPLPEQFSFVLAAFVCTKRMEELLCTISSPFGPFSTQKTTGSTSSSSSSTWVIAVAVLMVLIVFMAAFAFLWYRGIIDPKSWFPSRRTRLSEPPFTQIDRIDKNRPLPLNRYSLVLEEMHRDTNLLLAEQYDDINRIGQIVYEKSTTNAARMESNTPKNRWVNILPFDHSRVKLQQIDEDDPTSDYINANYIPGFNNKREYIATQGPLPGTIDDFWRMVWEHNVRVIVMLTLCKEGNRFEEVVKCEKYWPDEVREPKQYGEVVVNPISISQLDKYNLSIFDVSVNGQQSRQVLHFHYLDFPDFSANVEFDHFINFVRTVRNQVPRDMTGPMVIHCSAGVGRTGTFIATDRLNLYLNSPEFDENGEVDIFGIVVNMRENRVSMVQTESQYVMIHDCFEKMLDDKKKSMQMTESDEHLYENQGFKDSRPGSNPFPEVLYENVTNNQQQTEL